MGSEIALRDGGGLSKAHGIDARGCGSNDSRQKNEEFTNVDKANTSTVKVADESLSNLRAHGDECRGETFSNNRVHQTVVRARRSILFSKALRLAKT